MCLPACMYSASIPGASIPGALEGTTSLIRELQTAEGCHVRARKAARALTSEPSLQLPNPTSHIAFPTVNTRLGRERLHGFLELRESDVFKVPLITRFLHELV